MDAGPKMDLVGNLTASVRAAGLHMGLYHSLREWYNPLYLEDNANNCSDPKFPDEVLLPTLKEIVNQYKVHPFYNVMLLYVRILPNKFSVPCVLYQEKSRLNFFLLVGYRLLANKMKLIIFYSLKCCGLMDPVTQSALTTL